MFASHVFGLRKAYEDGSYKADGEFEVEGGQWLATDEGNVWLLKSVDSIVEALSEGKGTSFASGYGGRITGGNAVLSEKSKL